MGNSGQEIGTRAAWFEHAVVRTIRLIYIESGCTKKHTQSQPSLPGFCVIHKNITVHKGLRSIIDKEFLNIKKKKINNLITWTNRHFTEEIQIAHKNMGISIFFTIGYMQIVNPMFYHWNPSYCQNLKSHYLEGKDIEQICLWLEDLSL